MEQVAAAQAESPFSGSRPTDGAGMARSRGAHRAGNAPSIESSDGGFRWEAAAKLHLRFTPSVPHVSDATKVLSATFGRPRASRAAEF